MQSKKRVDPSKQKNNKATPKTKSENALKEVNASDDLDPTRYGDWEKAGRCIDF